MTKNSSGQSGNRTRAVVTALVTKAKSRGFNSHSGQFSLSYFHFPRLLYDDCVIFALIKFFELLKKTRGRGFDCPSDQEIFSSHFHFPSLPR